MVERPLLMSNPHADRVRRVASLAGRSTRLRTGQIIVEGPQAVRELLAFRSKHVHDVYLTHEAITCWPEITHSAHAATRWVHPVTEDVARAMSANAQGVVAVADIAAIGSEVPQAAAHNQPGIVVPTDIPDEGFRPALAQLALARIQDPGNVGTMIRCADAMGVTQVWLLEGSADPTNPKVIRSSAGSVFHVGIKTGHTFAHMVAEVQVDHAMILGTSGHDGSVSLNQLLADTHNEGGICATLGHHHVWVLGNEAQGLSAEEEAQCDVLVRIPMSGHTESLNVASAAAMCLWTSALVAQSR